MHASAVIKNGAARVTKLSKIIGQGRKQIDLHLCADDHDRPFGLGRRRMLIVRPSARFLGGQLQLIPFFLFIVMTGEI